jgi:septal ring factor EnvC (AmiA/AmiB activator)
MSASAFADVMQHLDELQELADDLDRRVAKLEAAHNREADEMEAMRREREANGQ